MILAFDRKKEQKNPWIKSENSDWDESLTYPRSRAEEVWDQSEPTQGTGLGPGSHGL